MAPLQLSCSQRLTKKWAQRYVWPHAGNTKCNLIWGILLTELIWKTHNSSFLKVNLGCKILRLCFSTLVGLHNLILAQIECLYSGIVYFRKMQKKRKYYLSSQNDWRGKDNLKVGTCENFTKEFVCFDESAWLMWQSTDFSFSRFAKMIHFQS